MFGVVLFFRALIFREIVFDGPRELSLQWQKFCAT